MEDKRLVWLWLVMVFGTANSRLWEMSANYNNSDEFYKCLKNHEVSGISDEEYEKIDKLELSDANEIIAKCNNDGINVYCYESEGYPEQLARIANPPGVLFSYGNLDFLNDNCVLAVVGTRKPSEYSLSITDRLCKEILDRNILLTSGFANGIDQKVNKTCLDKKIPAVAVCGTAVDYDYPKGSVELKRQIVENGGVVISEYFPGTKPFTHSFINRNRIMVGISAGVLFIEAGRNSHGLDNYEQATAQGKPVFVIPPHDIFDSRYFGQRYLIRNECQPVFNADDIVYFLSYDGFDSIKLTKSMGEFTLPADDSGFFPQDDVEIPKRKKSKKRNISDDNKEQNESVQQENSKQKRLIDISQLEENEALICKTLENGKMQANDIAIKSGLDIGTVLATLTMLELDAIVESSAGKQFELIVQITQNGE